MTDKKTAVSGQVDPVKEDNRAAPFTLINYMLFGIGLLDIIIGWFLLRGGHITIAPIMLIAGYCVIIPLAIMLRKKKAENA